LLRDQPISRIKGASFHFETKAFSSLYSSDPYISAFFRRCFPAPSQFANRREQYVELEANSPPWALQRAYKTAQANSQAPKVRRKGELFLRAIFSRTIYCGSLLPLVKGHKKKARWYSLDKARLCAHKSNVHAVDKPLSFLAITSYTQTFVRSKSGDYIPSSIYINGATPGEKKRHDFGEFANEDHGEHIFMVVSDSRTGVGAKIRESTAAHDVAEDAQDADVDAVEVPTPLFIQY